jgi:hypothetical protein
MILDEVFEQKNDIARAVSEELEKVSPVIPECISWTVNQNLILKHGLSAFELLISFEGIWFAVLTPERKMHYQHPQGA